MSNFWLAMRLRFLGSLVCLFASLLIVLLSSFGSLTAAEAGLALSFTIPFAQVGIYVYTYILYSLSIYLLSLPSISVYILFVSLHIISLIIISTSISIYTYIAIHIYIYICIPFTTHRRSISPFVFMERWR